MLDYKIYTFLKLCEIMNYRATAEALNMTQPAVTQQIQLLEQEYSCKLFEYNRKKLSQTDAGKQLEAYARSAMYNEYSVRKALLKPTKTKIRVGATKTIGDYVIPNQVIALMQRDDIELTLVVDNTEHLLKMIDTNKLDIALIEGFFDKKEYGYSLMKEEDFVGICSNKHRFSGKKVALTDLFDEKIIYREKGSGTRAILEQFLLEHNYSLNSFKSTACISSFKLIKELVLNNCGISFVYDAIAKSNKNIGTFTVKGTDIKREFNFVYLKGTSADKFIQYLR